MNSHLGKFGAIALAATLITTANAQANGELNNVQFADGMSFYPTWQWLTEPTGGPLGGSFTPGTFASGDVSSSNPYGFTPSGLTSPVPTMYCTSIPQEFNLGDTFPVYLTLDYSAAGYLVDTIQPTDLAGYTALQLAVWTDVGQISFIDAAAAAPDLPLYQATYTDYLADLSAGNSIHNGDYSLAGSKTAQAYDFNTNYPPDQSGHAQSQIAPYNPGSPIPNVQLATPGPAAAIPFALGLVGKLRRRNKSRKS